MRVIGMGVLDGGDDGVGRVVARRVRERAGATVEVMEVETPAELLDAWRGADEVIVVDALRSGRPPGAVIRVDPSREELPIPAPGATYGLALAEALALGRALEELPRSLVIYGIEGARSEPGTPLTPKVAAAADRLADSIASGTAR